MRNKEIDLLREDVNRLNARFDDLIDVLVEGKILRSHQGMIDRMKYKHLFVDAGLASIQHSIKSANKKLIMIIDHLNLEFEWVDCIPHFELKKKDKE